MGTGEHGQSGVSVLSPVPMVSGSVPVSATIPMLYEVGRSVRENRSNPSPVSSAHAQVSVGDDNKQKHMTFILLRDKLQD